MKNAARLLALLALATAGCVDYKVPLNFADICAAPDDAQACGFAATCEAVLASARPFVITQRAGSIGGGLNALFLPLQLDNQMPDNHDTGSGQVNTHDAIIESYDFTYEGQFPATKVTNFFANGRVPAEGSTVVVVPVIPQASLAEIQTAMAAVAVTEAPVVVTVVAKGKLLDGSDWKTGEYRIAVDVVDAVCADPSALCKVGDVVYECPNFCQTASYKCVTP